MSETNTTQSSRIIDEWGPKSNRPFSYTLDELLENARDQSEFYAGRVDEFLQKANEASTEEQKNHYRSLADKCMANRDNYRKLQFMYGIRGLTSCNGSTQEAMIYCGTAKEAREHILNKTIDVTAIFDFANRQTHTIEKFLENSKPYKRTKIPCGPVSEDGNSNISSEDIRSGIQRY